MPSPRRIDLPAASGSYVIWLELKRKRRITVGSIGELLFQPGYYAYCGSAFGPGGLKARLSHHLHKSDKPRWHIDYLKNIAHVAAIWYITKTQNLEHLFASHLSALPGSVTPVRKFGASDCNCYTHLIYFKDQAVLENCDLPFADTQVIKG